MSKQHPATHSRLRALFEALSRRNKDVDEHDWANMSEEEKGHFSAAIDEVFPVSETAPLVAGDLKTQREIHDSYAPSAIVPRELAKRLNDAAYKVLTESNGIFDNEWRAKDGVAIPEFPVRSFTESIENLSPIWYEMAKVLGDRE